MKSTNNGSLIKGDYKPYTDYRPSCQIMGMIMKQNEITNTYDLKNLLIHNAVELQEMNRNFFKTKMVDGKYYIPDPNNQIQPFETYKKNLLKQTDLERC